MKNDASSLMIRCVVYDDWVIIDNTFKKNDLMDVNNFHNVYNHSLLTKDDFPDISDCRTIQKKTKFKRTNNYLHI